MSELDSVSKDSMAIPLTVDEFKEIIAEAVQKAVESIRSAGGGTRTPKEGTVESDSTEVRAE